MKIKLGSYQIYAVYLRNKLQSVLYSPFSANYNLATYLLVTGTPLSLISPSGYILEREESPLVLARGALCWKEQLRPGKFGSCY